jgi:hypothetical protein
LLSSAPIASSTFPFGKEGQAILEDEHKGMPIVDIARGAVELEKQAWQDALRAGAARRAARSGNEGLLQLKTGTLESLLIAFGWQPYKTASVRSKQSATIGGDVMLLLNTKLFQTAPDERAFASLLRRCVRALLLCFAAALVFIGNAAALALAPGTVVGWGNNDLGQTSIPAGLNGVVAITAGNWHGLALKSHGTVVGWGRNAQAQASVPAGLSGAIAIAAGAAFSLALKDDGTVIGWGSNDAGQISIPAGLTGVVAIAAGGFHSMALKNDGSVVAWGSNAFGETSIPVGLSDVTAIAAGGSHSLALKADGTIVGWGNNQVGQTSFPINLSGVTAIEAGEFHSLALTQDGTVVGSSGYNGEGQTSIPAGLSGVIAVAAASRHSLAVKSGGNVIGWGLNDSGQTSIPANLSEATAIAGGRNFSLAANTNAPPSDVSPPTVTMVAPTQNAVYLVKQRVFVGYSCQDPSGVTLCSGSLPVGALLDTSRKGSQTFFVTATDGLGNTGSTLINFTVQAAPPTTPPPTPPRRR